MFRKFREIFVEICSIIKKVKWQLEIYEVGLEKVLGNWTKYEGSV